MFRGSITAAAIVAAASGAATGAAAQQAAVTLPANSDVAVTLNEELTTARARQGERFGVTVSRDVLVGGRVAIPRGTPGTGEVVLRTNRGAYGRSGKLEIALRSIDLAGQAIPVTGRFRAEGKGATAATIGTVVFGGLIAGAVVKGRHATFEQGREFHAFTVAEVAMAPAIRAPRAMLAAADPLPAAPIAPPVTVVPAYGRPVVAVAYAAPVASAVDTGGFAIVQRTPAPSAYQSLLAAQQGVRGRSPQGWTISD